MKKIFLSVFVCLLLIVSFGETKPARPLYEPPEIKKTEFFYKMDLSKYGVYKGDLMSTDIEWLDTGIYIKKGMNFRINATGIMSVSGESWDKIEAFGQCTPKGMDSNPHGFYYGMLRGRIINREARHEYFFHVGEMFIEQNVRHEGKLEISVLPTPWVREGKWAIPSGIYNVSIFLR